MEKWPSRKQKLISRFVLSRRLDSSKIMENVENAVTITLQSDRGQMKTVVFMEPVWSSRNRKFISSLEYIYI